MTKIKSHRGLKNKHFVLFITFVGVFACRRQPPTALTSIEAQQIRIDDRLAPIDSIEQYIRPYRNRINEVLDSVLAYVPHDLTKTDGTYNTSAGNLLTDVIYSEAQPIYHARTGNDIDFVLMNHGGIRADIPKGYVNARTAYEVMPFENSIIVVDLPGKAMLDLVDYLIKSKRPHPFSHLKIVLDHNDRPKEIAVNGQPLDTDKTYHIATSDYLVTGGDNMWFFKDMTGSTDTDYLIRNALIDYFKKVDTVFAQVDDRFVKLN